MAGGIDLLEGVLDQPLVVFLRQVPLKELRRNHDRQIDRFVPDLLERALGLELNLALGVPHDVLTPPPSPSASSPREGVRHPTGC